MMTGTHSIHNNPVFEVSQWSVKHTGSRIDHDANGSIAGADVCTIETNNQHQHVNVGGMDNHELTDIPLVTCDGVVTSNKGPLTLIMNWCALTGKNHSIHAASQLEYQGDVIDDKALANNYL